MGALFWCEFHAEPRVALEQDVCADWLRGMFVGLVGCLKNKQSVFIL
jgi:hypothetical protein